MHFTTGSRGNTTLANMPLRQKLMTVIVFFPLTIMAMHTGLFMYSMGSVQAVAVVQMDQLQDSTNYDKVAECKEAVSSAAASSRVMVMVAMMVGIMVLTVAGFVMSRHWAGMQNNAPADSMRNDLMAVRETIDSVIGKF